MNMNKKEKRGDITFYLQDNIEFMKGISDNFYDIAIVDPPYGIGIPICETGTWKRKIHKKKDWDNDIPSKEYFDQLFRVSKHQIIWGGNYFIEHLKNTPCMIFWDKKNGENFMSDGEMAWTSFKTRVRRYIYNHIQDYNKGIDRIHPTQKPIDLYRWLLQNYAKQGDKILDTHGGSFTHAKAADMEGFYLDIIEIDQEYFDNGLKAFDFYKRQLKLF